MQASQLVVPEPLPDDGEDVTSALETAAIFNAQGDMREAARWVRRAAEAASDVGADMRALTLARVVADLNTASIAPRPAPDPAAGTPPVAAMPPVPATPAVAPVPAVGAGTVVMAPPADAPPPAEATSPIASPAPVPAPAEEAPPPPPLPPLPQRADVAPGTTTLVTSARPAPSPPPLPSAAEIAAQSAAAAASAANFRAQGSGAPSVRTAILATPASVTPASAPTASAPTSSPAPSVPIAPSPVLNVTPIGTTQSRPPAVPAAEPLPVVSEAATAPALVPAAASGPVQALLHQAIRASIEPTNETGVFRMKLLAGNELSSLSGHEALVVLMDPKASLLQSE
jgi:hypothetical protein